MSSKNYILQNITRNIQERHDRPIVKLDAITYDNLLEQFVEISQAVGGHAVVLEEGQDINTVIRELYPDAKEISSSLKDITLSTLDPDSVVEASELNNVDLAVIEGELGVAENGCIWIPQEIKHKALYFITQYLVIVLDKNKIVNNMHEAYAKVGTNEKGFGVFISGPSKTADIEQALVVGAHGPKGLTVILK